MLFKFLSVSVIISEQITTNLSEIFNRQCLGLLQVGVEEVVGSLRLLLVTNIQQHWQKEQS
jgi:hypothetical protein